MIVGAVVGLAGVRVGVGLRHRSNVAVGVGLRHRSSVVVGVGVDVYLGAVVEVGTHLPVVGVAVGPIGGAAALAPLF